MKGSSHRGHYPGIYGDDRIWDKPRYSAGDDSSGFEKEEIDHAIALSLSEIDQKGKKVIVCEETDLAIALSLSEIDQKGKKVIEIDHAIALSLSETDQKGKKVIVCEEIDHAIALSLSEIDQKGKTVIDEDEQDEDERHAIAQQEQDERRTKAQQEEDERRARAQLEEDEQLATVIQESLIVEAPRCDSTNIFQPFPVFFPSGCRICAGCNTKIGHEQYLSRMGAVWHPECFCCHACNLPIIDVELSSTRDRPYHKYCYKKQHHPKCYVCHNFIPANSAGLTEYKVHPFWLQMYCPSHESDGTTRCCSCERMEQRDTKYLSLDDGRKLCLECLDSAILDTHECQPLYLEIQEFYEGLNMKVEQQVPLLLVERPALNEAMEGEKNGHHHLPETRGLCMFEEQTVNSVRRRLRIGAGYQLIDTISEPYRLNRGCEVTAILILYGLPRLLTGLILAHEMMHAWLRLKGYSNLRSIVEEGICQVLAHKWLESEIYAGLGSNVASSSSSSASSMGKHSDFEKEFGKFLKHLIESDTSSSYGDGFREGNKAVKKYGLKRTLDHILKTGSFPR